MIMKMKNKYKIMLILTIALTFSLKDNVRANTLAYPNNENTCEYTDTINGVRYSKNSCDNYYITSCQPASCGNPLCIYSSRNGSSANGTVSRYDLMNAIKEGCEETPGENQNPGENENPEDPGQAEDPNEDVIPDEEKLSATFYDKNGKAITVAIGKETNNIYALENEEYTDVTRFAKFDSNTNVTASNFEQFTYLFHTGSTQGGSYVFGKSCDIKTNQYSKTANFAKNKSDVIVCVNKDEISSITGADNEKCNALLGDPHDETKQSVAYWLQWCLNIIKYAAIIALLAFSTIDFVKALVNDDKDGLKKALMKTLKRFVFAVLIFFLPIIIEVLMKIFGAYGTCGIG